MAAGFKDENNGASVTEANLPISHAPVSSSSASLTSESEHNPPHRIVIKRWIDFVEVLCELNSPHRSAKLSIHIPRRLNDPHVSAEVWANLRAQLSSFARDLHFRPISESIVELRSRLVELGEAQAARRLPNGRAGSTIGVMRLERAKPDGETNSRIVEDRLGKGRRKRRSKGIPSPTLKRALAMALASAAFESAIGIARPANNAFTFASRRLGTAYRSFFRRSSNVLDILSGDIPALATDNGRIACHCAIGSGTPFQREHQEDRLLLIEQGDRLIAAVADGNSDFGDVTAEALVRGMQESARQKKGLENGLEIARKRLEEVFIPDSVMAATYAALELHRAADTSYTLTIVHQGDTQVLVVNANGSVDILTKEHTVAQETEDAILEREVKLGRRLTSSERDAVVLEHPVFEAFVSRMVEEGIPIQEAISFYQAKSSNMVTNTFSPPDTNGTYDEPVVNRHTVNRGQRIVIASDGLFDVIPAERVASLSKNFSTAAAFDSFLRGEVTRLAKAGAKDDNRTWIIIDI